MLGRGTHLTSLRLLTERTSILASPTHWLRGASHLILLHNISHTNFQLVCKKNCRSEQLNAIKISWIRYTSKTLGNKNGIPRILSTRISLAKCVLQYCLCPYRHTMTFSPGRVRCAKTGSSLTIGSARMLATITSKVPSSFTGNAPPSATDNGSIASARYEA